MWSRTLLTSTAAPYGTWSTWKTDRIVERTARNALAEESGRLPGSYVFELKSQMVAGLAH
jgi:hypothetical protein